MRSAPRAVLRGLRDLGFWGEEPLRVPGAQVKPRDIFDALAEKSWGGEFHDQLILRVEVEGQHEGRHQIWRVEALDAFDEETGFTAMQRMTGFPAAMVVEALARGEAQPGAQPVERALPPGPLVAGLGERGIRITEAHG